MKGFTLIHTHNASGLFFELYRNDITGTIRYEDSFGEVELYHKTCTIEEITNRVLDACEGF